MFNFKKKKAKEKCDGDACKIHGVYLLCLVILGLQDFACWQDLLLL